MLKLLYLFRLLRGFQLNKYLLAYRQRVFLSI